MIIVKVTGGLGNQMFQYAAGRMLSKKLNKELYFDISFYMNQNTEHTGFISRNYDLDNYDIAGHLFTSDYPAYETFERLYILQDEFCLVFYEEIFELSSNNNYLLIGHWQSWKYFENIKEIIRNELTLPLDKLSNKGKDFLTSIKRNTSVAIHFRRTDYNQPGALGYLPIEYYVDAVKYISSKISNPLFFIFSDDLNKAEEIISQLNVNYIIVNGLNHIEDLYLISNCQHNIIANSTFSWWAAWLNNNSQKKIVAPRKWYQYALEKSTYEDLIPPSWVCF